VLDPYQTWLRHGPCRGVFLDRCAVESLFVGRHGCLFLLLWPELDFSAVETFLFRSFTRSAAFSVPVELLSLRVTPSFYIRLMASAHPFLGGVSPDGRLCYGSRLLERQFFSWTWFFKDISYFPNSIKRLVP